MASTKEKSSQTDKSNETTEKKKRGRPAGYKRMPDGTWKKPDKIAATFPVKDKRPVEEAGVIIAEVPVEKKPTVRKNRTVKKEDKPIATKAKRVVKKQKPLLEDIDLDSSAFEPSLKDLEQIEKEEYQTYLKDMTTDTEDALSILKEEPCKYTINRDFTQPYLDHCDHLCVKRVVSKYSNNECAHEILYTTVLRHSFCMIPTTWDAWVNENRKRITQFAGTPAVDFLDIGKTLYNFARVNVFYQSDTHARSIYCLWDTKDNSPLMLFMSVNPAKTFVLNTVSQVTHTIESTFGEFYYPEGEFVCFGLTKDPLAANIKQFIFARPNGYDDCPTYGSIAGFEYTQYSNESEVTAGYAIFGENKKNENIASPNSPIYLDEIYDYSSEEESDAVKTRTDYDEDVVPLDQDDSDDLEFDTKDAQEESYQHYIDKSKNTNTYDDFWEYFVDEPNKKRSTSKWKSDDELYYPGTSVERESHESLSDGAYRSSKMQLSDDCDYNPYDEE